jgi:transglutaminase-like putative cysteine protease
MGIKVALEHRTSYTFDRLVEVHPHVVRLRPAPHSRTPIEAYSLTVEPSDHFINWQQDAFGNFLARLVFPNRARSLTITVGLIADMKVINPFDFFIEDWAEHVGFTYPKALAEDLKPYLRPIDENGEGSGPGDLTQAWVKNFSVAPGTRTIDFLVALNRAVNADVGYSLRMEAGVQTPDHTLRTGIGSCRDSAWLLVSILRQLGLAARFVSGYLVQLTSDVEALDGPSGPAADFTDLHAWTEVYIPGAGWIGLDPTSGLFAGEGHIPLSATPHPESAAPITGATEPCQTTLDFSNVVTRVHEDPRVTLPYTEAAWGAINALGVGHRGRRAAQAPAGIGSCRATEEGVGSTGPGPARPGQVVSRRTVAALADWPALAYRRRAGVDERGAAGRSVAVPAANRGDRPRRRSAGAWRHRRRAWAAGLAGAARLRGPAEPARQRSASTRR